MTRFSEIHLSSFRQSFHLSLVTISPAAADTLVQRGMLRKVVRKNHRLEILDCVIKVERKVVFFSHFESGFIFLEAVTEWFARLTHDRETMGSFPAAARS